VQLNDRWESVIATLCQVNGWDVADAEEDIERSRARYRELSSCEWGLDLTLLRGWVTVDAYPDLIIPSEGRATLGNTFDKTKRKLSLVLGADIPEAIWRW
jgi:outer membrane protease